MHWLYHSHAFHNDIIVPEEEEQRHLRALRLRDGEHVMVTDGKGAMHQCEVVIQKKHTELRVHSTTIENENPFRMRLAIAPTKNTDRIEWLIEKAVELGIRSIHIIKTEHSERVHLKTERLQRVAIAAIKQSRKPFLPEITDIIPFQELLQHTAEVKCIAHCADDVEKKLLTQIDLNGKHVLIAIGPEGDFSMGEIQQAKAAGFVSISLGRERLRTETAGLTAVAFYAYQNITS